MLAADAPAKINLLLKVLGRRGDGYREIRSVAIGVNLADRLTCRITREPGISLTCSDPGLANSNNLAYRAASKLADRLGRQPSLSIHLEKRIPVAAGMGGGSSDAAAVLRLCNELWQCRLADSELAVIGAELGSDVPLFFSLPAVRMTGRGDRVECFSLRWSGCVLLVHIPTAVSTAEVYGAWQADDSGRLLEVEDLLMRATKADQLNSLLCNDLEPAVFRVSPPVASVYHALMDAGYGPLRVSGAGSTLFRLFDDRQVAERVSVTISQTSLGVQTQVVAAPVGLNPFYTKE